MIPEMVLPTEGLPADLTRVGPLIRVCPLVNQKVVGLGEMATTVFTDELLFGSGWSSTTWSLHRGKYSWWKVTDGRKTASHWIIPARNQNYIETCPDKTFSLLISQFLKFIFNRN